MRKGTTLQTHILITFFWKKLTAVINGTSTDEALWRRMLWSFRALAAGFWPTHDDMGVAYSPTHYPDAYRRAGTPLAGGYYAVLWLLRGDLDYFYGTLKLNYHASLNPCFCCRANTNDDDLPWTDFSPTAACFSTVWSNAHWLAAHPEHHIVFDHDGVGILSCFPDTMHDKHSGVDSYFLGGVLKFLTHHFWPGTPIENLQRVYVLAKTGYKHQKIDASHRFTNLTLGMYVTDDFPVLKGRAAQVRHFAPALLYAFEHLMDPTSQAQRQIRLGLIASIEMDTILDEAKEVFRLPNAVAERFIESTFQYLSLITALRNHFQGILIFHVTIKAHYLVHIAFMTLYISPRLGWCYSGEDFIGKVKASIAACHRGTPPRMVINRAIARYARGMGFDLLGDKIWTGRMSRED